MTERYAGVQIQGIRIDSQQGPAHEHALPEGRPGWGFVLWLIGYALGIMLFAFVLSEPYRLDHHAVRHGGITR